MVNNSIKHLCFDKDGIIIDVHAYWRYNCKIRAKYLIDYLNLEPSLEGQLLWAMGIDPKSGKIRKDGPVGYHPRNIVIDHTIQFLNKVNKEISISEVSRIYEDIDTIQQKKVDFKIKLLNGVRRCFQSLKVKGVLISIYTSDRHSNAKMIIEKMGLSKFIDIIVGGDDVNKGKPNPDGFIKACHALSVKPDQSAYIGDTVSDMVMGKMGGAAMTVGLETGLCSPTELQKETEYTYPTMIEFNAEIQKYL